VCCGRPVARRAAGAGGEYGNSGRGQGHAGKVAAGLKTNEAQTLANINKGEYKDRDLYPFCGGPDGKYTAHGANASVVGQDLKGLTDKASPPKPLGQEIYATAQPGKISEISYMWPRPKDVDPEQKPVSKVSYITKVGDQICGVGYYK
jgi:hypothetical protein